MTKYFIDTEFIEETHRLFPISIGIATDDGREYYAVCSWFPELRASLWVRDNVIAKLPARDTWKSAVVIADELRAFVDAGGSRPEFWGYYADYDFVIFTWLLGGILVDFPKGWPKYCLDLKQSMRERGIESMPPKEDAHDALADARWTKKLHEHVYGRC